MLQHKWILKILAWVKEGSHKRPHNVWFYLYETSRTDISGRLENRVEGVG
jgi:hypothetical protein